MEKIRAAEVKNKADADALYERMVMAVTRADDSLESTGIKRIKRCCFTKPDVWTSYALLPNGSMVKVLICEKGALHFEAL